MAKQTIGRAKNEAVAQALENWLALPEEQRSEERPYIVGFNAGYEFAMSAAEADRVAVRRAALEEAANVADGAVISGNTKWCEGADHSARKIAAAIRALNEPDHVGYVDTTVGDDN